MTRLLYEIIIGICATLNSFIQKRKPYTDDVIVSFLFLHIGDLLLASGVISEFLSRNKRREVSILCDKGTAAMANELGIFKNVYCFEGRKTLLNLMKVKAKLLITLPPDCPTGYRQEYCAALVTADNKIASRKRSHSFSEKEKQRFDKKYKMLSCDDKKYHFTERCADFFSLLCEEQYSPRLIDLRPMVEKQESIQPYYVLNLGSSQIEKCWPAERFAYVAEYIRKECALMPVLVGSEKEAALAERFAEAYSGPFENRCGKTSLRELISLIGNAQFYLGNDTGTTHIAAACNVPNFSVASLMYAQQCLPYPKEMITDAVAEPAVITTSEHLPCTGCRNTHENKQTPDCTQCITACGTIKCVYDISVDDVIEVLRKDGFLKRERALGT